MIPYGFYYQSDYLKGAIDMDMPVKTENSQEKKTQTLEKFRPLQMLRPFEDMERAFERMLHRAWPSPLPLGRTIDS